MRDTDEIRKVCALLDHKRAAVSWIVRPALDADGRPEIVRMARVCVVYPLDGAGPLRTVVTDWGHSGTGEAVHTFGRAGGYGYDKRTAALAGAAVVGVKLGDHGNRDNAPTLEDLLNATTDRGFQRFNPETREYVEPSWAAGLKGQRWTAFGGAF